ncbi:30S ribosomal protein S20 [Alkalibaculum sp. M08DMB]|uniref:Small ribosomal subunit protein bS20 n=1 Tax=Alkalibaculum sporogenes TaxID=2655001 RepID=A0A6A7K587_9FIRM|nr:30S ribosomal protein S20 [Alkalibaculum sporogenes]MPW24629.1 30S ribosomal protein S20 [Alkalibaculum sporogenes]
MANIKSAIKRVKLTEIRTLRNKSIKSTIKTTIKKFESAVDSSDKDLALEAFKDAVKKIDSGVSKGVFHKNSASRKKSTLARKLNAM